MRRHARVRAAGTAAGPLDVLTRGRRVLWTAAAALLLLAPTAARGQQTDGPEGAAPVEAGAGDPASIAPDVQTAAPAGEPFVAPRSDRAYHHVFLAFGIAWALMLGFVVVLGRRFAAVERDLSRLGSGDG